MSKSFKYSLYINDVLIEKFYKISEIDEFLENYIGYIGKLQVIKIK